MKKYFKITSIFFISLLLISCGFKKINSSNSKNYTIENININGDNRIGYLVKNEIFLNSSKNSENQIDITLRISKRKNAKEKNISGRIKKYTLELIINVTVDEINSSRTIKRNFTKSIDYDVMGNHSDTINVERKTTIKATELITEDIVNFLIIAYRNK